MSVISCIVQMCCVTLRYVRRSFTLDWLRRVQSGVTSASVSRVVDTRRQHCGWAKYASKW